MSVWFLPNSSSDSIYHSTSNIPNSTPTTTTILTPDETAPGDTKHNGAPRPFIFKANVPGHREIPAKPNDAPHPFIFKANVRQPCEIPTEHNDAPCPFIFKANVPGHHEIPIEHNGALHSFSFKPSAPKPRGIPALVPPHCTRTTYHPPNLRQMDFACVCASTEARYVGLASTQQLI
jgi:hypothetical protein